MLKFMIGSEQDQTIGIILQPFDTSHLREKPGDHLISVNGAELGRPDARVVILYFRSPTQARKEIKQKLGKTITGPATTLTFATTRDDQKLIGIVLTENILARFEKDELNHFQSFDDPRYDLPGLRVLLTYSASNRGIVRFMSQLGMKPEQFSTDPNLRPLWENFRGEVIENIQRMALAGGIPSPDKENVQFRYGRPEGISDAGVLSTRGQDMAYFAAYPNETEYYRRIVPGEFPSDVTAEWVRVVNLPPELCPPNESVRTKTPMNRIGGKFVAFRGKKEE